MSNWVCGLTFKVADCVKSRSLSQNLIDWYQSNEMINCLCVPKFKAIDKKKYNKKVGH